MKHPTRSIDGAAIVFLARGWIGTKYVHQMRHRRVGVDCVGLIRGVGAEAGVLEISDEDFAPFAGYRPVPSPRKVRAFVDRFLELASPADGAIALLGYRPHLPTHFGIGATFEGRPTLIHAHGDVGRCVEHGLAGEWRSRVISWHSFPGVELSPWRSFS